MTDGLSKFGLSNARLKAGPGIAPHDNSTPSDSGRSGQGPLGQSKGPAFDGGA
jgi:hypothetical protein